MQLPPQHRWAGDSGGLFHDVTAANDEDRCVTEEEKLCKNLAPLVAPVPESPFAHNPGATELPLSVRQQQPRQCAEVLRPGFLEYEFGSRALQLRFLDGLHGKNLEYVEQVA